MRRAISKPGRHVPPLARPMRCRPDLKPATAETLSTALTFRQSPPNFRLWAGHCVAGAGLFHLGSTTRPNPWYSPPLFLRSFSRTTLKSSRSGLPSTWHPIGDTTKSASCKPAMFSVLARRLRPTTLDSTSFAWMYIQKLFHPTQEIKTLSEKP